MWSLEGILGLLALRVFRSVSVATVLGLLALAVLLVSANGNGRPSQGSRERVWL